VDNDLPVARSSSAAAGISRLADARLLLAFAVAPFVAGGVMFALSFVIFSNGLNVFAGSSNDPFDAAMSLGAGVATLSLCVTVLAALPGAIWMARHDMLSFRNVLLLGAALGNLPFVVIVAAIVVTEFAKGTLSSDVPRLWEGTFGTVRAIALGLLVGTPTAAVFWLIGLWRNDVERSAFLR
jgi:hypothetical protein